jgi:glyoxylase-like metal-dependent hydrolase (beta-lactamase superfamily II)
LRIREHPNGLESLKTPSFVTAFEPQHGQAVSVADGVARLTAPNSGPFTFHGTNTYIVGRQELAVIDPGPDDEGHLEALIKAIAGRPVTHIFVTHTHMDHSPLARKLKQETGGEIVGHGPHIRARPLTPAEARYSDASSDLHFVPDRLLRHDEVVATNEWVLRGVFTPGHTANHMAFALDGTDILFSGDHVMAWATTIIAPPDGSMNDYLASLDVLIDRDDKVYFPGHGGPVAKPRTFVRALKNHRLMREASILQRLKTGDRTIAQIVQALYKDTDKRLHGAAALTVFAHLERLINVNIVRSEEEPSMNGSFALI